MEGKFVAAIPPSKARGAKWDAFARQAQDRPGEPLCVAEDAHLNVYKNLKMRSTPPFVQDDGQIEVNMRNSYVNSVGTRHGDVYLTWHPKKK